MAKFVRAPDGQVFGTQYISHVSNPYVWFQRFACDVTMFTYGDKAIVHRVILDEGQAESKLMHTTFINKLTSIQ